MHSFFTNKANRFIESLKIMYASRISRYSYTPIKGSIHYNRILDNNARAQYTPIIEQMILYLPQMMKRKIPEANIQQSFVLDTVVRFASPKKSPQILCVGSYEDTAATSLKMIGYKIIEIDPAINYDLETYYDLPSTQKGSFDIIFSTSVIEHVDKDEPFVIQIAELLAPGGVAVLTCDFNNSYRVGDRLPQTDLRFYTKQDLLERILPKIPMCKLVDEPQWDCIEPDFIYDNCRYTFASIVFQKR